MKPTQAYIDALQHAAALEEIRIKRDRILGIKSEDEPLVEERRWCYREMLYNRNLTTMEEKLMYYNALLSAVKWGMGIK